MKSHDFVVREFFVDLEADLSNESINSNESLNSLAQILPSKEHLIGEIHLFICRCSEKFIRNKINLKQSSAEFFRPLVEHYIGPQFVLHNIDSSGDVNNRDPSHKMNHGKPYFFLNKEKSICQVSFTHSMNWLVAAFVQNFDIGVDIEFIEKNRPFSKIASKYFSQDEKRWMEESEDSVTSFYRLWTLKEAFIKAKGGSVFFDLKSIQLKDFNLKNGISDRKWLYLQSGEVIWQDQFDNFIVSIVLRRGSISSSFKLYD